LSSSPSFLSSLTRLFLIFAVLRRRLCHHRRHSPASSPSLLSFAVVYADFLSASPSFLSSLTRLFLIFAVIRRHLCQLFVSFAVIFVIFDASFSHLCRPSPSSMPTFCQLRRLCVIFDASYSYLCRCLGLSLPAGRVYQRALLRMHDLLTGGVGKRGPPKVGSDYQAGLLYQGIK